VVSGRELREPAPARVRRERGAGLGRQLLAGAGEAGVVGNDEVAEVLPEDARPKLVVGSTVTELQSLEVVLLRAEEHALHVRRVNPRP
jgi:hypothetical protein